MSGFSAVPIGFEEIIAYVNELNGIVDSFNEPNRTIAPEQHLSDRDLPTSSFAGYFAQADSTPTLVTLRHSGL